MKQNILAVMERLLTKQDFQNLCENYDVLKKREGFLSWGLTQSVL